MNKLFTIVSCFLVSTAAAQPGKLYTVEMIKARAGEMAAFEAAWQTHVSLFHANDKKTRYVFSILSGPQMGYYQLMEGPASYAAMDGVNPQKRAHDLQYDEQVLPKIAVREGNRLFELVDSLSYRAAVYPEKIWVSVFHLKRGALPSFLSELKRTADIDKKINSNASYRCYVLQLGGSVDQVMLITHLSQGFAQLEAGHFPAVPEAFKKAYMETYSAKQWNRRETILQELVDFSDSYIAKLNKELSSPLEPTAH